MVSQKLYNLMKFLIIFLPGIIGFLFGQFCKVQKTSGKNVNFRPPAIVFGIIWFILYFLIGISLYYSKLSTVHKEFIYVSYIILNISLCSWIYLYSCKNDKINAIYSLVVSLIFAIICCIVNNNIISQCLLVPLIGWLFLATLINVIEVQKIS